MTAEAMTIAQALDRWPYPWSMLEEFADEAGLNADELRDYLNGETGLRLEAALGRSLGAARRDVPRSPRQAQRANVLQTNAAERDDTKRDDEPPQTPEPPATEPFPVTGGYALSRPTEKLQL